MPSPRKNSRELGAHRKIARELALLSISQISESKNQLTTQELFEKVAAAISSLLEEIEETLETASSELKKGNDRLLNSDLEELEIDSARAMVADAIELTRTGINKLAVTVELRKFVHKAEAEPEIRNYVMQLVTVFQNKREPIDAMLTEVLFNWSLHRITRIDRDILRIAVAEMQYLGQSTPVAINEAVELAKRYSDDEGRRFINGVLRRIGDRLNGTQELPESLPSS
jgi:transcription antitermination protein NusB